MKKLILSIAFSLLSMLMFAQSGSVRVKGYTKKDGSYIAPYTRSKPNKSKNDNYSSKGNYNPNTGKKGSKKPKKTR